ncbi:MAG: PP2C family protein-serine/threonine phosphatase [Anaerolineae bacterium]|nr:PP2C family protein-serine/threonine phosphatase [Anaerolineae bacterium]
MLTHILALHQSNISALADSWLAAGARSVSLWETEATTSLACWPPDVAALDCTLTADITVGDQQLGRLKVDGPTGATPQTRLDADAAMLAALLTTEQDMKKVTTEFIDTQDRLLALYKLNESAQKHLSLDDTLHLFCAEAQKLVNAISVFVLVVADDQIVGQAFTSCYKLPRCRPLTIYQEIQSKGLSGLLHPEHLSTSLPSEINSAFVQQKQIRANINTMMCFMFSQPAASIMPQLKMATAIADFTSRQIESALHHQEIVQQARMKTELDLAAQIQLQLLPRRSPKIPGVDLAAASRPAREVGGDFYDFIVQPGWPFIFTVGDVSGKGMSAAMLMAMTRSVLRSKAGSLPTPQPEFVLTYSNEVMYDDFTEVAMFATVFVGRYDPKRQELSYANAGHSPVIYRPAGGPAEILQADGPAMGVLPNSLSEDFTIPFGPDDLLVVATDGFSEARNLEGEMFGYSRLIKQVELLADHSAQFIVDELFSLIRQFSAGQVQDDDQTLLVIKGVAV